MSEKGSFFTLDDTAGEWFTFFSSRIDGQGEVKYLDPLPDAGRVCVRSIVPLIEQQQTKRKRRAEFVPNPKTRQMERVAFFDDPSPEQAKTEREDIWDYAITGFENILDADGNPIPCTRENKLKLMSLPVFDRFIARCLQILSESGVRSAEEQAKNA